ncbi:DNA polymerase beta superfamily protein [Streptomyces lydicus]|uniref:nucleotidyltransferase domain-containing protein n=1 Tax=Streptomyces lydicus TaxID=47763 RepID=UPI0037BA6207
MPERAGAGERDAVLRAAGLPAVDLAAVVAGQDDPLVFATVSGAHLYGFPSRDSDVDLRGAHLLPAAALVGLHEPEETRTRMWDRDRIEMDLVSHDLRKFARLLLRRNGYVLEQLLSPLVVHTTDLHRELIAAKAAAEHGPAGDVVDPGRLRTDIEALHARLDAAQAATALPAAPAARDALHDLIVRARLDGAVAPTGRRAAASAER